MKKITIILGSAFGVLLVFSVFSYAKTLIQSQKPKPAVQEKVIEVAGQIPEDVSEPVPATTTTPPAAAPAVRPGEMYSATAYSLRGRTASGQNVTRGLIAADPRVLPIGTRVRLEAGPWSGEYTVADTGGAIRGRKIDVWTPSSREAMQFGRRPVKLTVLALPASRSKAPVSPAKPVATSTSTATDAKQEK